MNSTVYSFFASDLPRPLCASNSAHMLAATLLLSAPALTPSVPGAGRRAVLAGASSILASKLATSAAVAYDEIPVVRRHSLAAQDAPGRGA